MANQKKRIIIICLLILVVVCVYFLKDIVIVFPISNNPEKIGILDGRLSILPDNVIISENTYTKESNLTHGDEMVKFASKLSGGMEVYYYDITNENNEITDDNIINGLNWMVNNNIKKVNISLSSKIYSLEVQEWIKENKDKITIFCSYNNRLNSSDYPAMYENVIASGFNGQISYKSIDKKYGGNKILLLSDFSYYEGTSYLSLITLVRYN
ncbi:hypothetical protein acsn021_11110 [Anaerocolumna cellulosilytica]|uniref:Peptidase S8/S53 domain-containing protein n=1 Tax=Anaerocolumna cellulosilytica TaxID=433286 RepID=A0A6S6R210_9FIRM|nr:S8 family serine peptidase [Anaerocolumna cellulosilytica]MBB5194598.1 hypothetical protein [Anaerocolumna cellulosilytica]BCJ93542.1 hypothetical protein acsn021_11110 [Anaerocolumna cellulosilytica]